MQDKTLKTGTTTVGVVCKDAVILAGDMRASMGYLIAHKNVEKVVKITDRIALTTAGSVADNQVLAKLLTAEMKLYRMDSGVEPSLTVAANLLSNVVFGRAKSFIPYMIQLILGGIDEGGKFALYNLGMGGSNIAESTYTATGSGSPMAFGVLEDGWKEGMSADEGVELVVKAIASAIKRDMATGNGVNVIVIDNNGYHKVDQAKIKQILETKSVKV